MKKSKKRHTPQKSVCTKRNVPLPEQSRRDDKSMMLPISSLKVGWNPRSDLGDISELEASVKSHGILTPLLVTKTESGLEIVAGHRRFECAKSLGIAEVPVRIIQGNHQVISVIDNLCREQLSGWDTCKAISDLLPLFDGHQGRLAEAVNKSEGYVSQALRVVREKGDLQRVEGLPLRELFQGTAKNKKERQSSGAIPGGRYGAEGALQFKERPDGFSLRLNFDVDRTPAESRAKMVTVLENLLQRLKGGGHDGKA